MRTVKKIIYIDGDNRYRDRAESVFKGGEYRCVLYRTGIEGLDRMVDEKPDLVVVDYFLPDISGEEVYTRFLLDPRFSSMKGIPFIALTNNGKVDKSKLYGLGFSACLSKPFRGRELRDFVEDVLVSHQLKMEEVRFWETIRESRDFLERVVESSADAIITTDTKGYITYCNRASEDLLGYSFEELIEKRVSQFFMNGNSELLKIAAVLRKREKVQNYQTVLISKDGVQIPFNLSISMMKNGEGRFMGTLGIGKPTGREINGIVDNNESDRLATVLETAVAVNHAINNPLVPILGNAQFLLQDENIVDEDIRRRLHVIVNNARRIHDFTQKLVRITNPVSKEYLKGTRMLDIEASVQIH